MADENDVSTEIARIRQRLADLGAERARLTHELETLEQDLKSDSHPPEQSLRADAAVTNNSSSIEKVELFRRLFAGRPDVFPVRWENRKTGGSGYSPACSNEWAKGICGKRRRHADGCLCS
ncbi:TOTE conflict system archaeo-eukaryotic primase domain-containing protein [Agrobacterium burrii]